MDGEVSGEAASVVAESAPATDPELILEGQGGQNDLAAIWASYVAEAMELDHVDGPEGVPGFEPFNSGRRLPDGRILVRGYWDGDEPIARWNQRNPDSLAPGEPEPPVSRSAGPPLRLFVVDAAAGTVTPVSHIPVLRPFTTAISVGKAPDGILEYVVLDGGQQVAYTAGFGGAAYDVAYVLYVAAIPAA